MKIIGFGQATEKMIEEFQKHIGFGLPKDYKQFLATYNGGTCEVRYSTFFVEDLGEEIPLDVLLGIGLKKVFDLQYWHDEYSEDLIRNCIIIGHDPGSGMIVLINDSEIKGIYYWDHSFYFNKSCEERNIYKIADSFGEFINNIVLKK